MLENANITVYNSYYDEANGVDKWISTQINGIHWFATTQSAITDKGLTSANTLTIRIPNSAACTKSFVDSIAYQSANKLEFYTLKAGDIIVKGNVSDVIQKPSELQKKYADTFTIVGVTDNLSSFTMPHRKVILK